MKFSRAELKQLDPNYLEQLNREQLVQLALKLLSDLAEARDRLNANPSNSSIPPSATPPWGSPAAKKSDNETDLEDKDAKEDASEEKAQNEDEDQPSETSSSEQQQPQNTQPDGSHKKPGKQKGAQGFGRTQHLNTTHTEYHKACECKGCGAALDENAPFTATGGHYTIDLTLPKPGEIGLHGTNTKHIYGKTTCSCGFDTHTKPNHIGANEEWSAPLSEANLIGPMLLAFLCFLKLRMHATGSKVQQLLRWLGLSLSIGCINKCFREAGRAVSPLEPQLLNALRAAGLVYADETTWKNRKLTRWLWVFCTDQVVYYTIASRSHDVVPLVLQAFSGILMSDGYKAYRQLTNRIRCWTHLERKGKGLEESCDGRAASFGKIFVTAFKRMREYVYELRNTPEEQRSPVKEQAEDVKASLLLACIMHHNSEHEKTASLAREIENDNQAIFRVLQEPELPLTNNRAEQQFRYLVILRSITYGSKSEEGCYALTLLASVTDTMSLLKQEVYTYLAQVFEAMRRGFAPPPIPFPTHPPPI